MKFGSKGQIPYVELNGEEIPDSNVIIKRSNSTYQLKPFSITISQYQHLLVARLKDHFGKNPDQGCTSSDLAIGHAVTGKVMFIVLVKRNGLIRS